MLSFSCTVTGKSPYSPSGFVDSGKKTGEKHDAYEERIWREKAHVDPATGNVCIPAMAFQKAIGAAASFTPRAIVGRAKQTYAQQIRAGVFVQGPLILNITRPKLQPIQLWCSPQGKKSGQGTRVRRIFPIIYPWQGKLAFDLYNPTVDKGIFETYLREAGTFIGVGRYRPEFAGGFNGRFEISDVQWSGGWTEEDMLRRQALLGELDDGT